MSHPQLPNGWRVYGVVVKLHRFKLQWEGARRNIGKKHEIIVSAPDEETAKMLALRRCYQTEDMAELFIDSVEAWEMEIPRNN